MVRKDHPTTECARPRVTHTPQLERDARPGGWLREDEITSDRDDASVTADAKSAWNRTAGGEHAIEHEPTESPRSLARVEWDYIQHVLGMHAGNVSAAARALGIHRRSLQRKLRRSPPTS